MSTARIRSKPFRRLVAGLAGLSLVAAGLAVVAVTAHPAEATTVLADFDPANIIDDAVMFNGTTMSAAAIQTFLNGKQPTCASGATCLKSFTADIPALTANPMCGAVAAQRNATAAQIIFEVARACNVNPQVILVMLQKEQTLVTGRTPYSGESVSLIYRKATGLGCPDTAACDPAQYGLFNQLYGVAYWLVRYTMPKGTGPGTPYSSLYNWFPIGKPNGVLYHPNAACGAKTITIDNKATASLYYYTPYQPNAASLAAGWGIGDSCSSYGNRNFYLYFTTWFGSTHYVVTGPIATFWKANGSSKGAYGDPIANAVTTSTNGGGSSQRFEHGTVFTSAAGTIGVTGAVLTEYTKIGGPGSVLGWPRKAASVRTGASGGTVQAFTKGTVYVSKAGTAAVTGAVYSKYVASGYETGPLGWPTADAVTSTVKGGATWQAFQGGRVVVTGTASTLLTGAILAKWLQRGAEGSSLGWPTGEAAARTAYGWKGTVQVFQTGAVFVRSGIRTVTGAPWLNYSSHGAQAGVLGWPTGVATQSTANGGGWSQRFANGAIFVGATSGAHAIKAGQILDLYDQRGGPDGTLGWFVSDKRDKAGIGGSVGQFTSGRVYSSKVGTVAVRGDILAKYLDKGGPGGTLGWPTSNAKSVKGVTVQTFQHGTISWTAAQGAKAGRT